MPFFKDLRRRSRANFGRDSSSDASNGSNDSNGMPLASKSTSTINSAANLSTAPSSLQHSTSNLAMQKNEDSNEAPPVPIRPPGTLSKRNSVAGSFTGSMTTAPKVPFSLYAPRIMSITENSWVNQKVLLVYGQAGQGQRPLDGMITITHHLDSFPPTSWQVCETHFKALVYLVPGANDLRIDFSSPKLVGNNSPVPLHTTRFRINYLPLTNTPPLQLAILLGKDSPGTFDAPPEKIQKEGNQVETAIRKYRMAAHLWSAFTAEQMFRHGFGRRTFRFDEEYQRGTLSSRDKDTGQMRNEARVHIIRSEKTVAEIRDFDVAQQNPKANRKNDLFSFAIEAVKAHFKPAPGQKQYFAVLILDSHWDKEANLITGHAALGGGQDDIQLGIFGSQALHTYPITMEEVVPALTDCTKTNTDFVAADGGEDSGTWWQAACIGIGAHLHEVGHLFGAAHQRTGIMEHEYWTFNRTFITSEPYSTRTKQQGLRPCLPASECQWHRLDTLRFRSHPCFRVTSDTPLNPEDGVQVWAIDQSRFVVTAKSGISFIELFTDGDSFCESWIEYPDRENGSDGPTRQVTLNESDLRSRLPPERKNKNLKFVAHSLAGGNYEVENVSKAVAKVKMPRGQVGFLGPKFGSSKMEGTLPQELLIESVFEQTKLMTSVRVYHGFSLDGMEFFYEDGKSQLFGKRSGSGDGKGKDFFFDTRRGETLSGFFVRAGFWIDGAAIITNLGRQSEVFGNPKGGSGHTLMPPRGYRIAGLSGTCAQWIDGISLIITR